MATVQEVAESFGITENQVNDLRSAMSRTWSNCCYDYIDCFEGGEREALRSHGSETAMIAECTIDADRVTTWCPDMELDFVYKLEDGSWRSNCIKMAEACWDAR
jgi:hypothetical protein